MYHQGHDLEEDQRISCRALSALAGHTACGYASWTGKSQRLPAHGMAGALIVLGAPCLCMLSLYLVFLYLHTFLQLQPAPGRSWCSISPTIGHSVAPMAWKYCTATVPHSQSVTPCCLTWRAGVTTAVLLHCALLWTLRCACLVMYTTDMSVQR